MFTRQAMGLARDLQGAGMDQGQAQALARVIGNCQAPFDHSGPVTFRGPVTFAQPPRIGLPGPNNGNSSQQSNSANAVDFAILSEDMTAGSPYTSVKAVLSEWAPNGFTNSSQVDVWPGPLLNNGDTISAGTPISVARNGDRLVALAVGPSGGTGGIVGGGGGGGGYVAILQANLTVGGSASARVASRSSGSWAEASPVVSLTVYDAFLSGDEVIPSGYRVWVQRELDGNRWIVTAAKAN